MSTFVFANPNIEQPPVGVMIGTAQNAATMRFSSQLRSDEKIDHPKMYIGTYPVFPDQEAEVFSFRK